MLIKIDVREVELICSIENLITTIPVFKDLQMKVESLPLGDIILEQDDKELLIIERKSIADLLASIKDGRYEEQSFRLNGLDFPNHNIMYIIEGDVNEQPSSFKGNFHKNKFASPEKKSGLEKLTAYSAMLSLNVFKGFSVFRTFNLNETALFICNSANKMKKSLAEGKQLYYQKESKEDKKEEIVADEKDYVNVVKKVKKDNITKENIGEIMLCQIPGISSVTALAIMQKYKTISNLINCLKENKDCMNDVATVMANGQQRKISKSCISNIIQFLVETE
jgi:ERCC4-type nuclease